MTDRRIAELRALVRHAIGPAPWYWQTFPAFISSAGQRYVWSHHGESGPLGYVVSLALAQQSDQPRLALNTYCRPFLIGQNLGVWCPEGRALRFVCFEPDSLKVFDLAEIAGWFKPSNERLYAKTAPIAEFEIALDLPAGTHTVEIPKEFRPVEEIIAPTSYKGMTTDDPAFALFVVNPAAGSVDVLPQRWFTAAQYEIGRQWIPRAARDRDSHRLVGECYGVGKFVLQEDGCGMEEWIEKSSGQ